MSCCLTHLSRPLVAGSRRAPAVRVDRAERAHSDGAEIKQFSASPKKTIQLEWSSQLPIGDSRILHGIRYKPNGRISRPPVWPRTRVPTLVALAVRRAAREPFYLMQIFGQTPARPCKLKNSHYYYITTATTIRRIGLSDPRFVTRSHGRRISARSICLLESFFLGKKARSRPSLSLGGQLP